MADPKFVELVTRAHEYLTRQQERLRREFAFGEHERWDWDQATGEIVFSHRGEPQVVAELQFVGSISTETGTWLWSWANPSIDPSLTHCINDVRRYGEAHGIWQLTTSKWEADEVDGWEMTSIAALILQAEGAYRTPKDTGFTYMLLQRVRRPATRAT